MTSPRTTIAILQDIAENRMEPSALIPLIADYAVFHSPVMYRPQEGQALVSQYLSAALQMFSQHGFHYVRKIVEDREAALEFVAVIDGIDVNGVDLISFDSEGKVKDFKVMIRPHRAIEAVREKMLAQLEAARGGH